MCVNLSEDVIVELIVLHSLCLYKARGDRLSYKLGSSQTFAIFKFMLLNII